MTNSYFKVINDAAVFFFDTHSKETIEDAWNRAYTIAEAYASTKSKVKDIPVSSLISTWKKPHESGPWSSASVVGEYNMSAVYLTGDSLN